MQKGLKRGDERDTDLTWPLCGGDAPAVVCRERSAAPEELHKCYLPARCVCSLPTTSLEQFRCSVLVLRTFYCVFCRASPERW